MPHGRTGVQVIWTFSVKRIAEHKCECTSSVVAHPTAAFIAQHGTSFEEAAVGRQRDGGDHNRRETPLFAESIARQASARGRTA